MFSYSFWSRTLLYNQVLILCVLYILTFIHHFVQNIYNYKIYPGLYLEQISSGTIIESVDSISKDERGFPLMQYIANGRISRGGYTFTHFKHHHRVLRLISYSMSV